MDTLMNPPLLERLEMNDMPESVLLQRLDMAKTPGMCPLGRLEMDTLMNPPLLERLEMNDVPKLVLLQRMDMAETPGMCHLQMVPLDLTMRTPIKMNWKTSPLSTWMKSLRASGKTKSRNSKPYQRSYQSLTSIPQGMRKLRMQQLNITPKHLKKSKLSLLQRLSEESMQLLDYDQTPMIHIEPQEMSTMTAQLTNSYPTLAETQTNPNATSHQDTQIQRMTVMNLQTRNVEFSNRKCPGSIGKKKPDKPGIRIVSSPIESLISLPATTKSSSNGSRIHEQHPSDSPAQSGTTSSRDKPSTLMQCSHHCTTFPLLKRTLDAWDQLRYPLVTQNLPRGSKQVANGLAHGTPLLKQLNSLSPTKRASSENTGITLKVTSLLNSHPLTVGSSSTIPQSGTKLVVDRTHSSPILIDSPVSTQQLSCPTESNLSIPSSLQSEQQARQPKPKFATASTPSTDVETLLTIAISDMLANGVSALATVKNSAIEKKQAALELWPKYLRYNIWDGGSHFSHSSADWTALVGTTFIIKIRQLPMGHCV